MFSEWRLPCNCEFFLQLSSFHRLTDQALTLSLAYISYGPRRKHRSFAPCVSVAATVYSSLLRIGCLAKDVVLLPWPRTECCFRAIR
jgi:hypothetical protein